MRYRARHRVVAGSRQDAGSRKAGPSSEAKESCESKDSRETGESRYAKDSYDEKKKPSGAASASTPPRIRVCAGCKPKRHRIEPCSRSFVSAPNRREPSGRDRKVALDVVTKPNQRSAVPRQGAENSDVNKVQKGVNTSRHSPNHTVRYLAYPSFSSLKCSS